MVGSLLQKEVSGKLNSPHTATCLTASAIGLSDLYQNHFAGLTTPTLYCPAIHASAMKLVRQSRPILAFASFTKSGKQQ